ncbi:MAG: phytanoyl-CoA dioxygenase family protein [Sphingomonas sp.]|jgi:hypothetical protein|uniref:phytanoyl-CoA dioxygenase family protein n=1 Tax=Sphingomonas sp. TaxID=28214 RepID=UPI003567E292
MTQRIFADLDRQRDFDRDGYTVVRLFSPEKAAALAAELPAIRPALDFTPNTSTLDHAYHVSLLDPDIAYRQTAWALVQDALGEPLDHVLTGYRLLTGGLLVKPAGAAPLSMHRDWTMLPDGDQVALNVWCPLIDVDEGNGALALLPGSHRLVPNIEAAHVRPFFADYGDLLTELSVSLPLSAGEAVIFDYKTIHGSRANRTSRPRPAISSACIPTAARAVTYALDRAGGGTRFELFAMDGAGMEAVADRLAGSAGAAESLGFVPNRNQAVSRAQFQRLIGR